MVEDEEMAPAGYRVEWVPDTGRWVAGVRSTGRCRYTIDKDRHACGKPGVASLNRGTGRPKWWDYCAEHLFGRRIIDGVVCSRRLVPDEGQDEGRSD